MGQIIQQIFSALSNEELSVMHNIVLWVNWFAAAIACYFNYHAATCGITRFRRSHFIVAGFALAYVIGYPTLIFTIIDPILWTEWFRGIAIFVWFFVWTAPAINSMKVWKEVQRLLNKRPVESHDH